MSSKVSDLSVESFVVVDAVVGEDAKEMAVTYPPRLLCESAARDPIESAG
jgi:hypothetical protein